ncbi:MAG: FHA domain-containing protein [Candidatus Schekmanbacteria bacterium]|nr:FHA domain-containing protein [Candidatus Schekmanbacteria bacterium]
MYCYLVVERAMEAHALFWQLHHQITVGREPRCDIVLASATASRRHALFTTQNGTPQVADLSANQLTFVNGQRLRTRMAVPLDHGDTVGFGPDGDEICYRVIQRSRPLTRVLDLFEDLEQKDHLSPVLAA